METDGRGFRIWPGNDRTFVNFGAVITALVTFMITAAVANFIFDSALLTDPAHGPAATRSPSETVTDRQRARNSAPAAWEHEALKR